MSARTATLLVAAACLIVLAGQAARWRAASSAESAATARLHRAGEDAATLVSLSARSERIAITERPPQDLIARLGAALTECGLSATLDGVHPESSAPIRTSGGASARGGSAGPEHRRQSARATLRNLTLEDLGRLLAHWRQTQALWSITDITLTHDGSQDPRGLYRAELTLAATYLDDGAAQ